MNRLIPVSSQNSEVISDEYYVNSNKETYLISQLTYPKTDFKSGYKTVEQQTPIIRGRKTFAFWTLVVLLFILAIGNLVLTLTMVGVLRIGNGMQSIEFLPRDRSIKLFGNVDLGRIYQQNGFMKGFEEENIDITADENSLRINLYSMLNRGFNKVEVRNNLTSFNGFSSFEVRDKRKESLFDVSNPTYKNLKVQTFKAKSISTNKIRSKIENNMDIEGDLVYLKGNEGSRIEGREIVWSADQDIYLRSINGSIVLSGKEGTYIDVERLPLARLVKSSYATAQFKICVCMPQGKLFRLPIANSNERVYCHQADMSAHFNPCM